ncbi:MAG: hypothetical protein WB421_17700 [Terriglobales bacterium]
MYTDKIKTKYTMSMTYNTLSLGHVLFSYETNVSYVGSSIIQLTGILNGAPYEIHLAVTWGPSGTVTPFDIETNSSVLYGTYMSYGISNNVLSFANLSSMGSCSQGIMDITVMNDVGSFVAGPGITSQFYSY